MDGQKIPENCPNLKIMFNKLFTKKSRSPDISEMMGYAADEVKFYLFVTGDICGKEHFYHSLLSKICYVRPKIKLQPILIDFKICQNSFNFSLSFADVDIFLSKIRIFHLSMCFSVLAKACLTR